MKGGGLSTIVIISIHVQNLFQIGTKNANAFVSNMSKSQSILREEKNPRVYLHCCWEILVFIQK